ncbi:hypothetical protein FJZ31_15705 [Candidatus Poribacteria bacterium]|nr:hypothetical protein [Candidatus Poribacteria bacterium]
MAQHNTFACKVKQALERALRGKIPARHQISLEVIPKGYDDYDDLVDVVIVSDYFRRWNFLKRIDFVWEILDSQLPSSESMNATIIPFTTREAERVGINTQVAQSGNSSRKQGTKNKRR